MFGRAVQPLTLVVAGALVWQAFAAGQPSWGVDAEHRRDNSGRQIAVLMPGVPHATAKVANLNVSLNSTVVSSLSKVPMSPEVKEALSQLVIVGKQFASMTAERANDLIGWLQVLWQQTETVPTMTPAYVPEIHTRDMRPIESTTGEHKVFYTSERRLKTVVGR